MGGEESDEAKRLYSRLLNITTDNDLKQLEKDATAKFKLLANDASRLYFSTRSHYDDILQGVKAYIKTYQDDLPEHLCQRPLIETRDVVDIFKENESLSAHYAELKCHMFLRSLRDSYNRNSEYEAAADALAKGVIEGTETQSNVISLRPLLNAPDNNDTDR